MANDKKEKGKKEKKPSALKRDAQSLVRNVRNRSFKSKVNTVVHSFKDSLNKKESSEVKEKLNEVYSLMDKGVKKGIYKLNKANRVKSRLTAMTKQN